MTRGPRDADRGRGRSRRRWAAVAAVVAGLAGATAGALRYASAVADRAVAAGLAEARRERAAGLPASAAVRLRALNRDRPGRGEVLFELGLSEAALGRTGAAVRAWERIPPASPWFDAAAARRGQAEILRGRFAAAEELLAGALDGPGRPQTRDTLVRLLRSEGRFAEARRLYVAGVAGAADLAPFLRGLARLDSDPFAVEGVRIYLDAAGSRAPEDDRVWLGRAHLATRQGRFEEAGRWLDACLKRRPTDEPVWRARLDWARAAGRPAEASAALHHLPADEAEALDVRGWFAAAAGRRDVEAEALERLLQREPGRGDVVARLAELATLAGDAGRSRRLRARKAALDRAGDAYRTILTDPSYARHAAELAGLARELGLAFEASGWDHVAGRPGAPPQAPPRPAAAGRTLAALLPDLPAVPAAPAPAARPAEAPQFTDDAELVGLRFVHDNGVVAGRLTPPVSSSGGVALLDYDGDGWLDVYAVQGGSFPPGASARAPGDRLFRNRGDGTFDDATGSSGLAGMAGGYGHGAAVGDYDNDGHPDLFVTRWRSYALYHNRGDGTFEDVTEAAGLGGDRDWPTSAAFADLDNDGDLDLYVCHYLRWAEGEPRPCVDPDDPSVYRCSPRDFPALPDHAFRNDGGRFVDVTAAAGFTDPDGRGLGVVAAHLDDDDAIDLFVANDMTANFLFRNLGGLRFEESAFASGVAANAGGGFQAGMGVACGDVDGDGRADLAVTNFYAESTTLFRNLGGGRFADRTAAAGLAAPSRFLLGFGAAFLDADRDGRLDLLTVNGHIFDGRPQYPWRMPAQLLLGGPGGRLSDVTARAGLPFQVPRIGRGLATGDLDNDGRVDAVVLAQNEPLAYFHNRAGSGHWLTLRLEGRASNRDAVGARVRVSAGGRDQFRQRTGGGSYQSAGDPRLHLGLGAATRAERVEVRWPSGRVDRHDGLAADAGYLLREGDPTPHPLPTPRRGNTPP